MGSIPVLPSIGSACCRRVLSLHSKFFTLFFALCDGDGIRLPTGSNCNCLPVHQACWLTCFFFFALFSSSPASPAHPTPSASVVSLLVLSVVASSLSQLVRCYLYHPPPAFVCRQSMYSVPVHRQERCSWRGKSSGRASIHHPSSMRKRDTTAAPRTTVWSFVHSIHASMLCHPSFHLSRWQTGQSIPFDHPNPTPSSSFDGI